MKKDAAVIKILTELGLRKTKELSEDEQHQYDIATDEDAKFLNDIKTLFELSDPNNQDPQRFASYMTQYFNLDPNIKYEFNINIVSDYNKFTRESTITFKNVASGDEKKYNIKHERATTLDAFTRDTRFNPFTSMR